jgi:mono/diheme cytochrome c family protein
VTRLRSGWRHCAAVLLALAALGPQSRAAYAYEPRINYMLHCMGCHTPDGSGEPGRVPSLKETLARLAASPAGRRFLVQVPGASQSPLSDAELAELLNWMIQTLSRARPERVAPFTAAEVAEYRHKPLVAVQATRARLLRSLPASGPATENSLGLK